MSTFVAVGCTVQRTVKHIGVTELRARTAEILDDLRDSDEPVAILQRSRTAAYLVDADTYEALSAELRAARRALFLREVRDAEAEYASGQATSYEDMAALLADLRG
jgi:prevent-host-death family protein